MQVRGCFLTYVLLFLRFPLCRECLRVPTLVYTFQHVPTGSSLLPTRLGLFVLHPVSSWLGPFGGFGPIYPLESDPIKTKGH